MTKVLKLALLGRPQISRSDAPLVDLVSAKAQALLYYLAVTGHPHSRQALAALLWGELPESDARRNLRGVLLKLRQEVAPHLIVAHKTLAFDHNSNYWLDVEALEQAPRRPARAAEVAQLQEAIALYRGDFLEDFHVRHAPAFDDWVMAQQIRLRERAIRACYDLMAYFTDREAYGQATRYARRLLELDSAREEAHRQLMRLLSWQGRRTAALSQYELCRHVLAAELGVAPSAETTALYEQIRAGELDRASKAQKARHDVRGIESAKQEEQMEVVEEPPPFIAGPPITYPARFFGRERELKRLFNLFRRLPLQNAAVIGPRRCGKTSLLHYLKNITMAPQQQLRPGQRQDWLPHPARYRWIFVDFQDARLGDSSGLLRYLLTHMHLPVPDACDLDYFLNIVSDELHTPTIIMFDEIGVALQRYPQLDDAFWESLRSLATNQVGGNLAFILTSPQRPSQLAQHSGLGSPFFNIFGYTAMLGPLLESEARQLMATSPIPFPEEDVAWILAESGRWPMPLQILCRERLLALEDQESGDAWREYGLQQMAPFKMVNDE